jgi:hypothetical protein
MHALDAYAGCGVHGWRPGPSGSWCRMQEMVGPEARAESAPPAAGVLSPSEQLWRQLDQTMAKAAEIVTLVESVENVPSEHTKSRGHVLAMWAEMSATAAAAPCRPDAAAAPPVAPASPVAAAAAGGVASPEAGGPDGAGEPRQAATGAEVSSEEDGSRRLRPASHPSPEASLQSEEAEEEATAAQDLPPLDGVAQSSPQPPPHLLLLVRLRTSLPDLATAASLPCSLPAA